MFSLVPELTVQSSVNCKTETCLFLFGWALYTSSNPVPIGKFFETEYFFDSNKGETVPPIKELDNEILCTSSFEFNSFNKSIASFFVNRRVISDPSLSPVTYESSVFVP